MITFCLYFYGTYIFIFAMLCYLDSTILKCKWYDFIPVLGLGFFLFEYLERKRN